MAMMRTQQAHDVVEPQDTEAIAMATTPREEMEAGNNPATDARNIMVAESVSNAITEPFVWQREAEGDQRPSLRNCVEKAMRLTKYFAKSWNTQRTTNHLRSKMV